MKSTRLSRRFLLSSGAVTLSLPLLEAMVDGRGRVFWSEAQAQTGTGTALPPRLITLFHPFGWGNNGEEFTRLLNHMKNAATLKSLADAGKVRALFNFNKYEQRYTATDTSSHASRVCCFATGLPAIPVAGGAGPSIDAIGAAKFGTNSAFPVLAVGCRNVGIAATNWVGAASYTSSGQPVAAITKPELLFKQLFGSATAAGGRDYRKSILDYVLNDVARLRSSVSSVDQKMLDEHTTHLRALEQRIVAQGQASAACSSPGAAPTAPANANLYYTPATMKLLMDLFVVAIKCGLTRYGSFQMGCRVDPLAAGFTVSPELAKKDGAAAFLNGDQLVDPHSRSHATTGIELELYNANLESTMGHLSYFLKQLDAIPDGINGATVLDNSVLFHASENQNGNHSWDKMQIGIYGGASGALKDVPAQLTAPAGTPYSSVLCSVLNLAGLPTNSFGTLDLDSQVPHPINGAVLPPVKYHDSEYWGQSTRGAPPFAPLLG
jgi:hypothetical protein